VQIGNDHAEAAAGGMDHLAVSQVNSHVSDMTTPAPKEEEISGPHPGKIQVAGH
jgi:hypothetical protein